jgi:1-acyl-sn-glycerol-3-phosphate acyltransferase
VGDNDQPWTRTGPARIVRGAILRGVFGTIIDCYACQRTVGVEHLERLAGPAIFVANHRSHVDTPVLLRALPRRRRRLTVVAAASDYFYARRSLAIAVSLAFGTVPLERRQIRGGATTSGLLERLLGAGWSLVVFAEGTRSRDRRVGVLRSGAAVLAGRHGVPLVPVHIAGTHGVMPPGSGWPVRQRRGDRRARQAIVVRFGEPIRVGPDDDPVEAIERVRLFLAECGADTTRDPRLAAPHATEAAAAAVAGGRPNQEL